MSQSTLVILMAGKGSRFKDSGINTPKAYLPVAGIPLFVWSLISWRKYFSKLNIIFVVQNEHQEYFNNATNILKQIGLQSWQVFGLNGYTDGPAETALCTKELVRFSPMVAFQDCDCFFNNDEFQKLVCHPEQFLQGGMINTFISNESRFSFVEVDTANNIVRAQEKQAISDQAIGGCYAFKGPTQFFSALELLLQKKSATNQEIYLSAVVQSLVEKKIKISAMGSQSFVSLGTPEEINENLGRLPKWQLLLPAT